MKKFLAVILAVICSVAVFTSCQKDDKKPASDSDDKNWTGFY